MRSSGRQTATDPRLSRGPLDQKDEGGTRADLGTGTLFLCSLSSERRCTQGCPRERSGSALYRSRGHRFQTSVITNVYGYYDDCPVDGSKASWIGHFSSVQMHCLGDRQCWAHLGICLPALQSVDRLPDALHQSCPTSSSFQDFPKRHNTLGIHVGQGTSRERATRARSHLLHPLFQRR